MKTILRNRKLKLVSKLVCFFICILYYGLVFYIVFLLDYRLKPDYFSSINSIPFQKFYLFIMDDKVTVYDARLSYFIQLLGNLLLLFPFPLTIETVFNKKFTIRKMFWLIFFTSLFIELTQFILNIGVFEVEDIILNCIGGFFGYFFFRYFRLK
jgi:glycopeptide antibiotics resistance protein